MSDRPFFTPTPEQIATIIDYEAETAANIGFPNGTKSLDDIATSEEENDTNVQLAKPISNKLTFLLTNARSLSPKINSLIDYFEESEVTYAMVTET